MPQALHPMAVPHSASCASMFASSIAVALSVLCVFDGSVWHCVPDNQCAGRSHNNLFPAHAKAEKHACP